MPQHNSITNHKAGGMIVILPQTSRLCGSHALFRTGFYLNGCRALENIASRTLTFDSKRPFRVLGVQQIAIGGTDRDSLRHLWVNLLGVRSKEQGIVIPSENVVEDVLELEDSVEIDLMTPIDINDSPKVHAIRSSSPRKRLLLFVGPHTSFKSYRLMGGRFGCSRTMA